MDKVACLPAAQRQELFAATAARRGIHAAIVEKDFWVCWVLRRLFASDLLRTRLVFKGGTSLSKVFGVIERFSEDVDLVLDWRLLGYGPDADDPWRPMKSNTQRDRFNREANERAGKYISGPLATDLNTLLTNTPGVAVTPEPSDPQVLNVVYPAAYAEQYLRPAVRLEIGPLASWVPSHAHTIRPYSAEEFPQVFEAADCPVIAIDAERTFWEKATILHQQAHRTSVMPLRYARHYYDLHCLAHSPIRAAALANLALLNDVVTFKRRFYPCAWARYEAAKPGMLRLLPPAERIGELRADYRGMRQMLFGEIPDFDDIVATLKALEQEINAL